MKIICTTSNAYAHLIPVFCYLFNKYWSSDQEVEIVGYNPPPYPLPDNFKLVSMGTQGDLSEWSTDLRRYFESIPDEYFIWLMEDTLIKKVDHEEVNRLMKYRLPVVGRIDLTSETLKRPYQPVRIMDSFKDNIYAAMPGTNYRLSTQPSIWNKKYLLEYLTPGLTPWQFEVQQVDNKWLILAQGIKAVFHNEGVRKHNPHELDLNGFSDEDVKNINSLL